jgi:tocopherol cyclase
VCDVSWAFSVTPRAGWGGGARQAQRATAGWLAALPVFEPHWQVLMAHGAATGWVQWGDTRHVFTAAPFYSEKNWGRAFPRKWFWAQCNSFDGHPGVALTAAGGVRDLPLGGTEQVALIGLHVPSEMLPAWARDGAPASGDADATAYTFIELVPWSGAVDWDVSPWGRWQLRGRDAKFEIALSATCGRGDGTPLRAPSADRGLAQVCRDTFVGELSLSLWRAGGGGGQPLLTLRSSSAALEVGGGPWFEEWKGRSRMAEPLRSALQLPLDPVDVVDSLQALGVQCELPPGL